MAHRPPTSGLAVTSLVVGIAGLVTLCCTFGVPSIGAVICGHFALNHTRDDRMWGRGMAIAGLIMGYIGAAVGLSFAAFYVLGQLGVIPEPPTPTTP